MLSLTRPENLFREHDKARVQAMLLRDAAAARGGVSGQPTAQATPTSASISEAFHGTVASIRRGGVKTSQTCLPTDTAAVSELRPQNE